VAKLISTYWRDIPALVIGRVGRDNHKLELHPRFAAAIDRAAMRAGKGSSDLYIAEWRRETEEVEAEGIEQRVAQRVAELEAQFSDDYLEKVVKAGGLIANIRGGPAAAPSDSGEST
jgi:Virulence factor